MVERIALKRLVSTIRFSVYFVSFSIGTLALFFQWGCTKGSFPEDFIEDRKIFYDSLASFDRAEGMFRRESGQSFVMRTPDQEKAYFDLINSAISMSGQVRNEFLDFLHPQLREMYREHLIKGKTAYYEGARIGSLFRQADGSRLIEKWDTFWSQHEKEIHDKAYPG